MPDVSNEDIRDRIIQELDGLLDDFGKKVNHPRAPVERVYTILEDLIRVRTADLWGRPVIDERDSPA